MNTANIQTIIAELEKIRDGAQITITLSELWEKYRPIARGNRSWRGNYSQARHLVRLMGNEQVMSITPSRVAAYEATRRAEPLRGPRAHTGRTVAIATVNREVALLKRMCSWGSDETIGLLTHSPVARTRRRAENNTREVIYTDDEIDRMLRACPAIHGRRTPIVRALILVLRDCGMRVGEARMLEFVNIDADARAVHLRAQTTKGRRARMTRISDRALDAVERLNHPGRRYIFENERLRRPYTVAKLSRWIRELVDYLGLRGPNGERPYTHDLRRTFSTMLRRKGVPEGVIMKMTGHRGRSTFDRYGIVGPEDVREAHRILDKHERLARPEPKVPLRRK